ncbi:hypothetical protein DQ354_02370 [Arthrobacter sp. AQ5-06]|nr:hypothetical protein DQ354_02370 [Arthrobacter sp. AQ5-06]
MIICAGDTGNDSGGAGETFAKGDAGTREMLTSAGTGAAGVGTLLAAHVVPSPGGGPSPSGESSVAALVDCVAPGLRWPEA